MCRISRFSLDHNQTQHITTKTSASNINSSTILTDSTLVVRIAWSSEWSQGSSARKKLLLDTAISTTWAKVIFRIVFKSWIRRKLNPTFAAIVNEIVVGKTDDSYDFSLLFFHCSCRHPSDSFYPGHWRCLYVLHISGERDLNGG